MALARDVLDKQAQDKHHDNTNRRHSVNIRLTEGVCVCVCVYLAGFGTILPTTNSM